MLNSLGGDMLRQSLMIQRDSYLQASLNTKTYYI